MTLSLSLLRVLVNWRLSLAVLFPERVLVGRAVGLLLLLLGCCCWFTSPDVSATKAVNQLAAQAVAAESAHPDSVAIILGDFNHTNLKKVLPRYTLHIDCATCSSEITDHCNVVFKDAYRAITRAPLRESDHATVVLIPTYRQKLTALKPTKKTVRRRTDESTEALRGCMGCTDFNMFKEACPDADTVTSYISWCGEVCTETKTVTLYGNDKPWFTRDIKQRLAGKNATFIGRNSGESSARCRRRPRRPSLSTSVNLKTSSLPTTPELSGKACSRSHSTGRALRLSTAVVPSFPTS